MIITQPGQLILIYEEADRTDSRGCRCHSTGAAWIARQTVAKDTVLMPTHLSRKRLEILTLNVIIYRFWKRYCLCFFLIFDEAGTNNCLAVKKDGINSNSMQTHLHLQL